MEKDSVLTGFVVGAFTPIFGYMLLSGIFTGLAELNLIDGAEGMGMFNRERTLYLLSICMMLIPLNIFKKFRWDDSMRGLVFPTLIYVAFWLYKYYGILFENFN